MINMFYSFVVPVYNRPNEVDELLESLVAQSYTENFEVVIVEDGSTLDSKDIITKYENQLTISYYYKENSGPGDSRNYGMYRAKGDYFIILDSDCILPMDYLQIVDQYLRKEFVDCFGGPDNALDSFTNVQKAINFSMTSFLTTGGIRGGAERLSKFQPRSFNMGLSKKAFNISGGFGKIHPGEDPDLAIRLWNLGFDSQLFDKAFVYHKRRIDFDKFYKQVNKFGKARPILNQRYPSYSSLTYWFPSLFVCGFVLSLFFLIVGETLLFNVFALYFAIVFWVSLYRERNLSVSLLAIIAIFIQFFGYGIGFMKSNFILHFQKRKAEEGMPEMFFK